jgi:soluble lytic murein transglycosylase-like protein
MNYKSGSKISLKDLEKLDKRYKNPTNKKASPKTSSFANKNIVSRNHVINFKLLIARSLAIATAVSFLWMLCDQANQPRPQAKAQTPQEQQEDPSSTQPRDALPRELPGVIEEHDGTEKLSIEDLFAKYFPEQTEKIIKISKCESNYYQEPVGWKPWIHNGTAPDDSWGLMQINIFGKLALTRPTAEQLKDPETNIKFARVLYDGAGKKTENDWKVCSRLYVQGKIK